MSRRTWPSAVQALTQSLSLTSSSTSPVSAPSAAYRAVFSASVRNFSKLEEVPSAVRRL